MKDPLLQSLNMLEHMASPAVTRTALHVIMTPVLKYTRHAYAVTLQARLSRHVPGTSLLPYPAAWVVGRLTACLRCSVQEMWQT